MSVPWPCDGRDVEKEEVEADLGAPTITYPAPLDFPT